jgi:hypothetical protein
MHGGRAVLEFNADVGLSDGTRWWCGFKLDGYEGRVGVNWCQRCGRFRSSKVTALCSLSHPTPSQIGVESIDQRDGSSRDARLKARRYDLAFEFITVASAPTSHLRLLNFWSVHVST